MVAGYTAYYGNGFPDYNQAVVVRYNANGALDTSFGTGGRTIFTLPQDVNQVTGLALAPDGKVVVGGYVINLDTADEEGFLERLTATGSPDAAFGTGGQTVTAFSGVFDFVGGPLAIRPDGRILLGGNGFDPNTFQSYLTVIQFTSSGGLDSSYGLGGLASISFDGDPNFNGAGLNGMTLLADGRVVAVGTSYHEDPVTFAGTSHFAVARFTAAGGIDSSFGDGGTVETTFNDEDQAWSVVAEPNGRLVVSGSTQDAATGYSDFALAVYNPDGSLPKLGRRR